MNHRPAAIPKRFQEKMVANDIYAVPGGTIKVEWVAASKDLTAGVLVTSQHSDIDMVNHVNNAAYVRWVMDEYRGAFPNAEISEFSINYLQEVLLGDTVRIYHTINDNTAFVMIENTPDQEPICRVRIGWN